MCYGLWERIWYLAVLLSITHGNPISRRRSGGRRMWVMGFSGAGRNCQDHPRLGQNAQAFIPLSPSVFGYHVLQEGLNVGSDNSCSWGNPWRCWQLKSFLLYCSQQLGQIHPWRGVCVQSQFLPFSSCET